MSWAKAPVGQVAAESLVDQANCMTGRCVAEQGLATVVARECESSGKEGMARSQRAPAKAPGTPSLLVFRFSRPACALEGKDSEAR
ncbi:MAG: hypothetical protein ACR2G5_18625 [Pyrinomonadaceae bacterium]